MIKSFNETLPKRLYDVKCDMSRPNALWPRAMKILSEISSRVGAGVSITFRFCESPIDNHAFFRLFEDERFSVARRSTEKTNITRTNQRYCPADCHGGYKRRRQSPSVLHVRNRILWFQPELNGIYSRLVRIARISQDALSVRQGLRTLPRSGKPITSRTHSDIWERESSRSIKINIAIRQAVIQLWTKPLQSNHMTHLAVICTRERYNGDNKHWHKTMINSVTIKMF